MLGIKVEISWTAGHPDIKGNEYTDQLAKETAEEAKKQRIYEHICTKVTLSQAINANVEK